MMAGLWWMAVAGGFLLLLLAFYLVWCRKRGKEKVEKRQEEKSVIPSKNFFVIERSEGKVPEYVFIDLQTTGLSTEPGHEDRILQISWLVVDESFKEVRRDTLMVSQESLGSLEARRVHRITEKQMRQFGISEDEMLEIFWEDCAEVPYWVFHNATFDLGILLGTVERLRPEWEEAVLTKQVICTMRYLSLVHDMRLPYLNLIDLTAQLTKIPHDELSRVDVISWRNVCLTRLSLYFLLKDYPDPKGEKGALPAYDFLCH